jgi:glutamate carboxypeptidase
MSLSSAESAALAEIEGQPLLDRTRAWAEVNSGSRNLDGLARMEPLLMEAFGPLGEVSVHDPAPATRMRADGAIAPEPLGRNIEISVRPDAPLRVLLTGHYDTVFGADHPFQHVRWLQEGVVNGPGVADMKGGIAVMLGALMAFEASPLADRLGWTVLLNADEEISSPGSAPLLAAQARGAVCGLTFEPALADGTLAGDRPGSGNFSVHITGRSAHAGREPEKGRNAVIAAADLGLRLSQLVAPDLKVNVARIEGGGPNNMVPETAVLRVNMRPATAAAEARALASLDAVIAEVAAAHEVEAHRHGGFARPPKPLDANQLRLFKLVRAAGADLGLAIAWKPAGGVCDGNNLAATGLAVVDTLGVRGGAIHSSDEFLITESLAERARLAALVLMRIARDGFAREAFQPS